MMYKFSYAIMSILIILSIIAMVYGVIDTCYTQYEVITYDNEVIEVNGTELHSDRMYVITNNEKIKIKSYKKVEG